MTTDAVEHRRDFFVLAANAFAAVGAAALLWPFIQQMNPDACTQALASIEVDLVARQGRPGDHRAVARQAGLHPQPHAGGDQEPARTSTSPISPIQCARNDALPEMTPATDPNRTKKGHENWLVLVGICTHLGCIPKGQSMGDASGRLRRLVLPVPRLALRHGRAASAKDRRRAISRCRPTSSSPTPRSRSAEGASLHGQSSRIHATADLALRQMDRTSACRSPRMMHGAVRRLPDAAQSQLPLDLSAAC